MQKYLLEFDTDNDGMLDFDEFKQAIKAAQAKLKQSHRYDADTDWRATDAEEWQVEEKRDNNNISKN